jgi:cell division protein FtsB
MPTTGNKTLDYILYSVAAALLLFIGYRLGRLIGGAVARRQVTAREQDLFTAQKGFKALYEQELSSLKNENATLKEQIQTLTNRVEEYRKKAAGYGGLFNSGGKKADAMYALLMENEALEEALYSQNEKLRQERTDSLKETLRSTGYRRVLMSQLLNDERIKQYVAEVIEDKHLNAPGGNDRHALPAAGESSGH